MSGSVHLHALELGHGRIHRSRHDRHLLPAGMQRQPARAQHPPVHVGRRGGGRRVPAVSALPARSRARAGMGRSPRAGVPGVARPSPTARSTTRPRTRWPRASESARATSAACSTCTSARRRPKSRAAGGRTSPAGCSTTPIFRSRRSRTAAGFNSVRQFNRVMKDVFRFTPQELRRPAPQPRPARRRRRARAADAVPPAARVGVDARLPRAPCHARGRDGRPRPASYRRVVELGGAPGVDRGVGRTRARRAAPPRPPPGVRRAGPPPRERAPPLRPRRRPDRDRHRARPRPDAAAAGARPTRDSGPGRDRPVRGERARGARPTGFGRPERRRSPVDSSSGSGLRCPASPRSASPTSSPTPRCWPTRT